MNLELSGYRKAAIKCSVSLAIDFANFSNEIKTIYSNVCNVIRMKNKNQADIIITIVAK